MIEQSLRNPGEWTGDRIENPVETTYKKDDRVKIKIGRATGKVGIVVCERRGNYKSWSKTIGDEAIGVRVDLERDIRWFDSAEQLEAEVS